MKVAVAPANETQRLMTLRGLNILDTIPEERFDRITRLAKMVFDVPIAVINLVDSERTWAKSVRGLDLVNAPRDLSFCGHVVADDAGLVIADASLDERFHDSPYVREDPSVRFYAGAPLRAANGHAVGTLCLIDRRPRQLTAEQLQVLHDLATMVEDELTGVQVATSDPLTGISNRRGFELLAATALPLTRRLGGTSTLLMFDLDGFKPINDLHGHAAGDRALVDFAGCMLKAFRDADVIARLGGDEFCVLGAATEADLAAPVQRLKDHLAQLPDRPYRLSFSVGAALYVPERHLSIADLLAAADQAMYEHKRDLKR